MTECQDISFTIPLWDESRTGSIAQRKAALASTERAQRQGSKSDRSLHHRQPALPIAIVPDRPTLLAAACNATPSRNVVERIMGLCSTRNGSVCYPSCVSPAPRPSLALNALPRSCVCCTTGALPPLRLSSSALCSYPISPPRLARTLPPSLSGPSFGWPLGPGAAMCYTFRSILPPLAPQTPFHFDFSIRLCLFHKQEGPCKRP